MTNNYGPYGPPPQQPSHGRPGQYPPYGSSPAPYGQPTGYDQNHPQNGQTYQYTYGQSGVDPRYLHTPPPMARPTPPRQQGWFSRHPMLTAGMAIAAALMFAVFANIGQDDQVDPVATPEQPAAAAPAPSDPDDTPAGGASVTPTEEQSEDASDEPTEEPTDEPTEEPTEEPDLAFGIGDAAPAGDLEFVVEGIETGRESIGGDFLNEQAQGQYVLVDITVTNIGNEAATFYDGDQLLIDTEGREHTSDSGAWMYLDDDDGLFLTDINPGNTASGTLVFDIPADATPASVILSDGSWFFVSEVEISLG